MNEKKLTPLEAYGLFLDDIEHCVQSGGCYSVQYKYKEIIKKSLKALEIINKKEVDVALLKLSKNVERYNVQIESTHLTIQYYVLTQEEYDLLKEVLL